MRDERGATLLEVLVALTILATAGTAMATLVGEGVRAVEETRQREHAVESARRVLAHLALRSRRELDLRIGTRSEGGMVIGVQRPRPGLYRLAVSDSLAPEHEIIVTVVHRPEPS